MKFSKKTTYFFDNQNNSNYLKQEQSRGLIFNNYMMSNFRKIIETNEFR